MRQVISYLWVSVSEDAEVGNSQIFINRSLCLYHHSMQCQLPDLYAVTSTWNLLCMLVHTHNHKKLSFSPYLCLSTLEFPCTFEVEIRWKQECMCVHMHVCMCV